MQTAAAKIISSGTVRCSRKLTRNGTVMVFPGQFTDPTMVIAWRKTWRTHFSVNLYEALDLPQGSSLQDYLLINDSGPDALRAQALALFDNLIEHSAGR